MSAIWERGPFPRHCLRDIGWALWQEGKEDDALAVYDAANSVWDDAIHIASPDNPARSLCGHVDRNLVGLGDPRPGSGEGCWTCLTLAERLAVPA